MSLNGDVNITILDGGGAVVVPSANLQVVIGTSQNGTAAQVVATQNVNTLLSTFGLGPLTEAAALTILAGGTVLAMKAATVSAGSFLPADNSVEFTGTGSSVITTSGVPLDDYNVEFLVIKGGTIGSTGITFQISMDAGRNFGPVLSLGTASTYTILGVVDAQGNADNPGITLNFAAGTLVAGDIAKFSTVAPATDVGSIQSCLTALQATQYVAAGWGSMQIVGTYTGDQASTIETYLDTLATPGFVYTRAMISSRDAAIPIAWGGAGETESTWITAVTSDFSAVSARRICANAGYYNMPSAFPQISGGSSTYRRPLTWALAAREVQIPPQRHAGRVRDGALSNIIVDPTNDPQDGFIYHDERINPGFDAARFCSARTRVSLPGFYIVNPNLMSPLGSVYTLLPLGNVMDVACDIVHQTAQQEIDADIQLNKNGTIYENEARALETSIYGAIQTQMIATAEISGATVIVDRTNNIEATMTVNIAVTIEARGYVLSEQVTIGFQNPFAAS